MPQLHLFVQTPKGHSARVIFLFFNFLSAFDNTQPHVSERKLVIDFNLDVDFGGCIADFPT